MNGSKNPEQVSEVKFAIGLMALLVLGLAIRAHQIDYNFDGDEIFSFIVATKPFPIVIAESLRDPPHPPLHNVLLHFWLAAWGSTESAARSLSVVASIAALGFIGGTLRSIVRASTALAVVAICALSAFFVYYGQQARPYALIWAAASFNLYSFAWTCRDPSSTRALVLWSTSCAVLLYSQYLAVLLLAPQFAWVLLGRTPLKWIRLLLGGLSVTAIAPWAAMAFLGEQSPGLSQTDWLSPPDIAALPMFFIGVFGWPPEVKIRVLAIILGLALVPLAVTLYRKPPTLHWLLVAMAVVPPITMFLLSHVWRPIWAPRQLLGSALAFLYCLAVALDAYPRVIRMFFVLLLVTWCVLGLPDAFPNRSKPAWREIAADIRAAGSDRVVLNEEPWVDIAMRFYAGELVHRRAGAKTPSERLVGNAAYVCRPERCDGVRAYLTTHRVTRTTIRPWDFFAGEPQHAVHVLWLEQRRIGTAGDQDDDVRAPPKRE